MYIGMRLRGHFFNNQMNSTIDRPSIAVKDGITTLIRLFKGKVYRYLEGNGMKNKMIDFLN